MSKIDESVESIALLTIDNILTMAGPKAVEMLSHVTNLFDTAYATPNERSLVLSILFGFLCASVEGLTSEGEREFGVLIGVEDRLRMHNAIVRVVWADVLKDMKQHETQQRVQ